MDKTGYNTDNFPLILGLLGLATITLSFVIELVSEKIHVIAWAASFFIMASIVLWRYMVGDDFVEMIRSTNPDDGYELEPDRFLRWFPVAFVIGFVATIVIYYNFILGMVTYLLMQLALIASFSGIFCTDIRYLWTKDGFDRLSQLSKVSVGIWTVLVVLVYSLFVYSGSSSLIVIPYVIALGTMAHFSWYGLAYTDRNTLFRWLPVVATAFFVFSDSLIGNLVYGLNKVDDFLYHIIDVTYVINIFLMTQMVLFTDTG